MNDWLIASVWMGLALAASLISIRLAISVTLVELIVGIFAGNFLHQYVIVTDWVTFLASLSSVLLTFLAGAEIEPGIVKRYWRESISIGLIAFFLPFLGGMAYAYYVGHWDANAAKVAGVALSTTSVAVVYAIGVETGLNRAPLGMVLLAASFVCNMGTVLALGVLFARFDIWLLLLVVIGGTVLVAVPKTTRWFFDKFGDTVSEPNTRLLILLLFFLGGLAVKANSEAVLTAYLLGIVAASVMAKHAEALHRMRSMVFSLLTPFYFIKAGMLVSLRDVGMALGLIVALFLVKIATKMTGIYPLTCVFGLQRRSAKYMTALMSTGLTFGSIAALFGLNHHYISHAQYAVLISVVIASAIIPTAVALRFFHPRAHIPEEVEVPGIGGMAELPRIVLRSPRARKARKAKPEPELAGRN